MRLLRSSTPYLVPLMLSLSAVIILYTGYTTPSSAHGTFNPPGGPSGPPPKVMNDGITQPGGPATGAPSGPSTGFQPPPGGSPGGPSTGGDTPPPGNPPYPPPNDVVGPQTGGTAPPLTTPPNAPSIPGNNPGGAQTGGSGSKGPGGASTKKNRVQPTIQITWEHWWARNYFQYMEFPDVSDNTGFYPATPRPKGIPSLVKALTRKSLDLLRPMLEEDSARLRKAALIGMARLNDEESYSRMTDLLQDRNQTVRDYAVMALGILEKAEAKHLLLHVARGTQTGCEILGQSSIPDYFRGFALLSLALGRTKGIDVIMKSVALDDSCACEVRAMALESLGLLGGEDSAKFLMDFVDNQKVAKELLASAVTALHKTSDPAVLPFLEKCLYSDCIPVRQSAAAGLGYLARPGDEEIVKKLYKSFKQTYDQALKGFCLVSMGQIGGPVAVQYLNHVARKGRSSEQPWACLGLGLALREREDDNVEGHLIGRLKTGGNRSNQGAAAVALGLMKSANAVDPLIRVMQRGDDPALRGYCALALGMIGDLKSVGPLRRTLQRDSLPQVRTKAAMALALMRNKKSVPDMVTLLLSSDNDTSKTFIALSLGYMADITVVEEMLAPISEAYRDELTRMHCMHVTSKLLSGWTKPYLERIAAGSNFACEYPMVRYLLDFGI